MKTSTVNIYISPVPRFSFAHLAIFFSLQLTPAQLPAHLHAQLQIVCANDKIDMATVTLKRASLNHFDILLNGQKTYWSLFINEMIID